MDINSPSGRLRRLSANEHQGPGNQQTTRIKAGYKDAADFFTKIEQNRLSAGRHPYKPRPRGERGWMEGHGARSVAASRQGRRRMDRRIAPRAALPQQACPSRRGRRSDRCKAAIESGEWEPCPRGDWALDARAWCLISRRIAPGAALPQQACPSRRGRRSHTRQDLSCRAWRSHTRRTPWRRGWRFLLGSRAMAGLDFRRPGLLALPGRPVFPGR